MVGTLFQTQFQAGDLVDAKTKIEGLNIVEGDILTIWCQNNEIHFGRNQGLFLDLLDNDSLNLQDNNGDNLLSNN